MDVKSGYKLTELGVIPEEWEVTTVGIAGQVLGGRQRSPHATGELCKYLRVANVFDGYLDTSDVLEMPFSAKEKDRYLLRDGDILLNEGQSLELVGRSAIYRGTPSDCCFQNTLIRFRASEGTIPEFAQLVFQRYLTTGVFASVASQTTSIAHLGTGKFAALPFPRPPVREQQAITAALGDVDTLIESLDRLIAKKRDIKQAAMQQLLTGETRLPGFSAKWEVKRLGDIGQLRGGNGFPTIHQGHSSGDFPFFKVSDMNNEGNAIFMTRSNNWISESVRQQLGATLFPKHSIVFAKIGAAIFLERKKILGQSSCLDNNMMGFIIDEKQADYRFLYYLLLMTRLGALVSTTALPSLNGNSTVRLPV